MPAAFAKDLCRYRGHGMPNTSDKSDKASVALGNALFDVLGVDPDLTGDEPTGSPFAERVAQDLASQVAASPSPSALVVQPERPLNVFQQYRHVGALADIEVEPSKEYLRSWRRLTTEIRKRVTSPASAVARVEAMVDGVEEAVAAEADTRRKALYEVGAESLLSWT